MSSREPAGAIHYRLREARTADIPFIREIERSAGTKFATIPNLADLATGEEVSAEKVAGWLSKGRIYLIEAAGRPIGFVAAFEADSVLYIAEISVHETQQRKGVGAMLLGAIFQWARESGPRNTASRARVSLTTYADVPWNGPWYQKHGFREVPAESLGLWHIEKMTYDQEERELVRPGYRRCCMLWEG